MWDLHVCFPHSVTQWIAPHSLHKHVLLNMLPFTVAIISMISHLLSIYFLLNFDTELVKFPPCMKCVAYKAPLASSHMSPHHYPAFLFSPLCSSMQACAPKGLPWPQSPTCVRRYPQPAYSGELAERPLAAPTHNCFVRWTREKGEKQGSKNMKISSEEWEGASAPAILV